MATNSFRLHYLAKAAAGVPRDSLQLAWTFPVQTDEEPPVGGSESMRAQTVDGRAVLVSGRGVYDISNCEDLVKKGEIPWPSARWRACVRYRPAPSRGACRHRVPSPSAAGWK